MERSCSKEKPVRLPPWFRTQIGGGRTRRQVQRLLGELRVNTVCVNAQCPNLGACWDKRAATFLILGNTCTRACRFCAIPHGTPVVPDPGEPERLAEAAVRLRLRFVVVTSVTRDDLTDGGAGHFAATLRALRTRLPQVGVEVLTPDFLGLEKSIGTVIDEHPTVFNHNIETCARLTKAIRSGADYHRSLQVLQTAARLGGGQVLIKSGLMLGMGETPVEIQQTLSDLCETGVDIVTIGQYLPPTEQHWPLSRYVSPDEFAHWGRIARDEIGFSFVVSAPQVRSSFAAEEAVLALKGAGQEQHGARGLNSGLGKPHGIPKH